MYKKGMQGFWWIIIIIVVIILLANYQPELLDKLQSMAHTGLDKGIEQAGKVNVSNLGG